jgi:hypothetical protein
MQDETLDPPGESSRRDAGDDPSGFAVRRREFKGRGKPINPLLGLALVGFLLAADYWVFRGLGESYLDWYLAYGPTFGLVFALVSAVVDLDRHDGLVSANPGVYFGAVFRLFGMTFVSWPVPRRFNLDFLLGFILFLLFVVAAIFWLIVIAPAQYLSTVICGAPSRAALASDMQATEIVEGDRRGLRLAPKSLERPEGSIALGFGARPVTVTSAVSSALVWALSLAT